MALNIPNVASPLDALLNGVNTGSTFISRIMQPILQREQMAQRQNQFEEEMKLRKAQFARSGANADLQRQLLQQQLIGLQHANDPMFKFNQFQMLQSMLNGGQSQPNSPDMQMPTDVMGQGMGMFSPEGLQDAQNNSGSPAMNENSAGINLDMLRKNPLLRGFFKQQFGYDPVSLPQTPEDKQEAALNLFKQKEAIKNQNRGGDTPTNTVLTQNQQAIQGIDSSLPIIDELINDKDLPGVMNLSPGKKAKYIAKTGGIIDTLVAAQNLPKVQASIDLVEQQIRRHTGETLHDYKERLKDLKKDLLARRERAQSVVKSRKINTAPLEDFSSMSDDELRQIAGGG